MSMQLNCQNCSKPILSKDISIQFAIAKCGSCNFVFNVAKQLNINSPTKPENISLPKNVKCYIDQNFRVIEIKWFSLTTIPLVFFCIFWDGFLVSWYLKAFSFKNPPIMPIIFPLLHLAVGIGMTYTAAASLLNKTWIKMGIGRFIVRHGPIPFLRNFELTNSEIKQLFVKHRLRRLRGSVESLYTLMLRPRNGKDIKVTKDFLSAVDAVAFERVIEKTLGIRDEPVPGEHQF